MICQRLEFREGTIGQCQPSLQPRKCNECCELFPCIHSRILNKTKIYNDNESIMEEYGLSMHALLLPLVESLNLLCQQPSTAASNGWHFETSWLFSLAWLFGHVEHVPDRARRGSHEAIQVVQTLPRDVRHLQNEHDDH